MSLAPATEPIQLARPGALGPATQRIQAIDAVRGFALLGIFIANMQLFAAPFGDMMRTTPAPGSPLIDILAFYFIKIFVDGKFYPLFSLLFGMGLALQWHRARAAGRNFWGTGVRRIVVLAVLGLVHATLLWYGDILFLYSTVALVLLMMIKARPRTLAITGAVLLSLAVVLALGFGLLMPTPSPGDTPAEVTLTQTRPFERLMEAFEKDPTIQGNFAHPVWIDAEIEAYRHGPFDQVMKFRLMSFAMFLFFCIFSMWWHIAAMFMFGAALIKAGLFSPGRRHWYRRFVLLGLLVGLPCNVLVAAAPYFVGDRIAMAVGMPLFFIGGPLLGLAYLGIIALLVERAAAANSILTRIVRALAAGGRMALTNYLLQSLIATSIFYYWGLGYFGDVPRYQRIPLVLGIFTAQLVFSSLWLSIFRFGPMEWLWRSLTYLRPQPLLGRASTE